jgi:hypothetical protein
MKTVQIGSPLDTQIRNISKIFQHSDYDPNTLANDICLVKLDVTWFLKALIKNVRNIFFNLRLLIFKSPVKFSEFIVPVCLPDIKHVNYDRVRATISSFVVNSKLEVDPDALKKSHKTMATMNDESCERKLNNGVSFFDRKLQICSYHQTPDAINDSQPVV